MPLRSQPWQVLFAVVSLLSVVPRVTSAAEWSYEPRASMDIETDTNKRLLKSNPKGSLGEVLDVGIALGIRTERTNLSLTPSGKISRYLGDQTLDSNTASLILSGEHRWERSAVDLNFSFARNSTLATELLTTGRVQTNLPVYVVSVNPSYSYQLSDKSTVQFFAGHRELSYENGLRSGLFDYSYDHLGASLSHAFNEITNVFVSADYSIYDVPNAFFTQGTYTVQVGLSRNINDTWYVSAAGGLTYSKSTQRSVFPGIEFKTSDTGQIYNILLSKRFEKAKIEGHLSSSLTPTSGGQQTTSTALSIDGRFDLSNRLKATLAYSTYTNSRQGSNASSNYETSRAQAQTTYRLNQFWSLIARYSYIQSGTKITAESHGLFIGIKYADDIHSVSR